MFTNTMIIITKMTQISSAKKLDELFDVSKLSESSLRKYQVNSLPMQSYFKLTEGNLQE